MDSWLDHIPTAERQRLKERFHLSEAEYEKLREKVKGPAELKEEMQRNELLAELRFAMDAEPVLADALRSKVQEDVKMHGLPSVVESLHLSNGVRKAVEQGKFTITVQPHPTTHVDQLVVVPEGKVAEALPISQKFSEQYLGQFKKAT